MICCFDVFYRQQVATAAAVTISDWPAAKPLAEYSLEVDDVGEYQAGEFYKRELSPLSELIKKIDAPIKYFVIDAYCHLSSNQKPGLGAYLSQQLPDESVVIGVAKNRFRDTTHAVELSRGSSVRKLFVTSIGTSYQEAADMIDSMHGEFRMPTILKKVDQLSRSSDR